MVVEKVICDSCNRELNEKEEYDYSHTGSARVKFGKVYLNANFSFIAEDDEKTFCVNCLNEMQDHVLSYFAKDKFMMAVKQASRVEGKKKKDV